MTTLLVQLSDTHIREPGKLAYGRVDTATYLKEAVASIGRLRQSPDAIVITGDLTDFGRGTEYEHLARLLSPLTVPVYLLPGNHDDRAAMRKAFPGHRYLGDSGFVQYTVTVGELVLLALDTSVPGRSEGRLCRKRLDWLSVQLALHHDRSVIVAMHHPPFRTLIGHMDEIGLIEGAEDLAAIVKEHPRVERIICGHLHRPIDVRFAGTIASTCPSPAHQVSLDLSPTAASAWMLEPPGFKLHALASDGSLVSHLAYCGNYEGPYPFHEAGKLID